MSRHLWLFLTFNSRAAKLRILVPWAGIEPVPPALEVHSLNPWTTREAPVTIWLTLLSVSCVPWVTNALFSHHHHLSIHRSIWHVLVFNKYLLHEWKHEKKICFSSWRQMISLHRRLFCVLSWGYKSFRKMPGRLQIQLKKKVVFKQDSYREWVHS